MKSIGRLLFALAMRVKKLAALPGEIFSYSELCGQQSDIVRPTQHLRSKCGYFLADVVKLRLVHFWMGLLQMVYLGLA